MVSCEMCRATEEERSIFLHLLRLYRRVGPNRLIQIHKQQFGFPQIRLGTFEQAGNPDWITAKKGRPGHR